LLAQNIFEFGRFDVFLFRQYDFYRLKLFTIAGGSILTTKAKTANLQDETVADLRVLAKEAGITNFSHMTKDELISHLGKENGAHSSSSSHDTNAVELLKKDHAKVKALFAQALNLKFTPNAKKKFFIRHSRKRP
jgi:transcription termination factor Rho